MRPFINVEEDSLPEAFHQMYLRLGESGVWGQKESYKKDVVHDSIFECESRISVGNLLQEPMISTACSSVPDLPTYVSDVLLGTKDQIIGNGYDYTYHDRVFNRVGGPGGQVAYVIKRLMATGYTNRAQMTTWIPELDSIIGGPPCFQRGWFKIDDRKLSYETDWRSRDFQFAWFENVIGMAGIAVLVRDCLRDYAGLQLEDGIHYVDKCNSLHVYEDAFEHFTNTLATIMNREGKDLAIDSESKKSMVLFKGRKIFSSVEEAKKKIYDPLFKKKE